MSAQPAEYDESNPEPCMKGIKGFQPGYDPRRAVGLRLFNGKTLAQMARESTPEALDLVVSVVKGLDPRTGEDKEYKIADRLKAAEYVLDRGWGKAVQAIHMDINADKDITQLTTQELLSIAAGATLEGECSSVPSNVQEVTSE